MKRKWIILVLVIILGLCCIGLVVGGGAYYYFSRPAAQAAQVPVPVVQIFYPPNLSEIPFGSVIPVGAEASVPEGNQVTLIQLWADGELVGEMYGSTVALTASWGWVPAHDGETTLIGRAYNQEGGEGTGTVQVQVMRDLVDSDQDGVPDEEDDCPDEVGAPEWNGCTPAGAGVIGDAWGPGGGNPADEFLDELADLLGGGLPPGEDPPSEDPPVIEPESDPPEPPPMALVEVEGLNLVSAIGARDVYCYLTLTALPVERVPTDAEGEFVELGPPGIWNISEFMGGDRGRLVDVPEVGPLHMELDCWGHFSDDPLDPDPRHMGIVSVDHGPADWDGHELIAHGEMDANWFDLTYRICRGSCEATTLPAPYNLALAPAGVNYELSWNWDEDPSVDNSDVGFYVYRDDVVLAHIPDNHPFNVIVLTPAEVEPPLCDQEFRFEVRAVRGADIQLSEPCNPIWALSPLPCVGENWVAIVETHPFRDSSLDIYLEDFYTRSHTDRVVIGAYPLVGGALADAFLFTWDGQTVDMGAGSGWANISYRGSEPMTTDGLRLFMITVADGVLPGGDIIYERDVPFVMNWLPGVPDLYVSKIFYPEGDDILRIKVRNLGPNMIEDWTPTFAFFQDVAGVRTRVDALDSPPTFTPVTIPPGELRIVSWPGWTPLQFALLNPIFEVEVDPDNVVAEFSEENNVYEATKPNIQVTLQTVRVLAHGFSDAAGFGGCFAGLSGLISIPPSPDVFHFWGTGDKATYPTFWDIYYPHELGLLVCPPQEFDVETELIPALNAGSCTAACSAYFGAHAQPIFAEGNHTWVPIPGWGDDYCSACYTLSGQTSTLKDTNVMSVAYAGGDLVFHISFSNRDTYDDGTHGSHPICDFDGIIPAGDMAVLPIMNRTLTDPGGNCEIVVSVEEFIP